MALAEWTWERVGKRNRARLIESADSHWMFMIDLISGKRHRILNAQDKFIYIQWILDSKYYTLASIVM